MTKEDYWRGVEIIAETKHTAIQLGLYDAIEQSSVRSMEYLLALLSDSTIECVDHEAEMWMEGWKS